MPPVVTERRGSRNLSITRDGGSAPWQLFIREADDSEAAYQAAVDFTEDVYQPSGVGALLRQQIDVEDLGAGCFAVTVNYESGKPDNAASGVGAPDAVTGPGGSSPPAEGSGASLPAGIDPNAPLGREVSFSTGGGTVHVTQSIATISATGIGAAAAPDFKGAIGVGDNGPEGVDIPSSNGEFSITWKVPEFTIGRWKQLLALTGCVNSVAWGAFGVREASFLGADGHYSDGDEKWTITYHFAFEPSYLEKVINEDITIPAKFGHDYLWILYEQKDDAVAHYTVRRPIAAYVEQVQEAKNFREELGFE